MRIRTFALAALVGAAGVPGTPAGAQDDPPAAIEWTGGLDEAVALSAKDGLPVILYFTFDT